MKDITLQMLITAGYKHMLSDNAQWAFNGLQGNMAHGSYYDVLGVDQQASPDQVKAAYQKLVLTLHPDKAGEESQEHFQLLQQAWQTLRDPAARVLYDHELSQAELRATVVLHDEIELADMDDRNAPGEAAAAGNTDSSCQHSYPCRCGDSYVLTAADMKLAAHTQQIILPCRSCSNHILVKLPP